MANVEKFEDLIAWMKAREFAHDIFEITCDDKFSRDFSLIDQIRRSSGSVMDNIAEGFERGGNKEFIQYLFIANGSLSEVKSQLYRAYDRNYLTKELLDKKLEKAIEIGKIIGGLINYLLKSDIKGRKFKENHASK